MLTVTDKAADKAKTILTDEGKAQHGIRIFIAGSGCCGPSYGLNIEENHKPEDEVVETEGLKIFLDKETSMNLADKQLDYYIGTEGEGFVSTDGKRLFVAFVDMVKANGAGFVEYLWPKPNFKDPVPKTSYVKGFAPWGWIIGSGIYIDDVRAVFMTEAAKYIVITAVIMSLILLVSMMIMKNTIRALNEAVRVSNSLAEGDLTVNIEVQNRDETGQVLLVMKNMVGRIQGIVAGVKAAAGTVAEGSDRLSRGADMVSQRTTEQAASAEEHGLCLLTVHPQYCRLNRSARPAAVLPGPVVQ